MKSRKENSAAVAEAHCHSPPSFEPGPLSRRLLLISALNRSATDLEMESEINIFTATLQSL